MKKWIMVPVLAIAFVIGQGCKDKNSAETAGEKLDKAVEKTKDETKKAADKTGDAIKDAGDKVKDATK